MDVRTDKRMDNGHNAMTIPSWPLASGAKEGRNLTLHLAKQISQTHKYNRQQMEVTKESGDINWVSTETDAKCNAGTMGR